MNNVYDLLEKYNINLNRVPSHEKLKSANFDTCKEVLEYLDKKELLSSKYIIHSLTPILLTRTLGHFVKLEKILTMHGYDAYSIMYRANKLLFSDDYENMISVIKELKKEEYGLDDKRIVNRASSLLAITKASFIERAIKKLNNLGFDVNKLTEKGSIIFEKRSLSVIEDIVDTMVDIFGKEEAYELIYKCPSILAKAYPEYIRNSYNFLFNIIGEKDTKKYAKQYTSFLYKADLKRATENYNVLLKYNLTYLLRNSANILMFGNAKNIETNYLWIKNNNIELNYEKATTILTSSNDIILKNYNFFKSVGLEKAIANSSAALVSRKETKELKENYKFIVDLKVQDLTPYITCISMGDIDEMKEINFLLHKEFDVELADTLVRTPAVLLSNYKILKTTIGYLKEKNLIEQIKDKPFVISETQKDKMVANEKFLLNNDLAELSNNIVLLSRGIPSNMKKIIDYFKELNHEEIIKDMPNLLTKKYTNIKTCVEYFIKENKFNYIISVPSLLLINVDEIERSGKDIKDLNLEHFAKENPSMYRGKNIKENDDLVKKNVFNATSGLISIYSSQNEKVKLRKEFYDKHNLTHLYENNPSILADGNIHIMEESYNYLKNINMLEIVEKSKSLLSRLKGIESIKARLQHLYNLGLTIEEIKYSPSMLIRYTDEEILETIKKRRERINAKIEKSSHNK